MLDVPWVEYKVDSESLVDRDMGDPWKNACINART